MIYLLLGCSWGVPNYFGPPGDPPETHTEYLLEAKGHRVFNCSRNGGSNLESLDRAKKFLAGEPISHPAFEDELVVKPSHIEKIDWIVWFQTDFIRDINRTGISRIDRLAKYTYSAFEKFFKEIDSNLALIGANMDLYPNYQEYFDSDFVISSWSSLILDLETRSIDMNDPDALIKFMDRQMYLQKLKNSSALFPDGSHPGKKAHARLVDLLCQTENLT